VQVRKGGGSPQPERATRARDGRRRRVAGGTGERSVEVVEVVGGASRGRKGKQKRRRERSSSGSVSSPEKGRAPRKRRKDKKKKERSRSSSSSESSSDAGGESSADSSGSSGSSSASGGSVKGRKGGRKKDSQGKWAMLNDIWPLERRPRKLQDKRYVEQLSWRTLNALQDRYEKEEERKGVGAAIFGKDQKLKKTTFKKKADDGFARLHPARFLRLPLAAPEKYWKKVPKCHEQRFRHVQLGHYGAESQVNEKVILAMHDRQVPIELKMLLRANFHKDGGKGGDMAEPAEVRHIQEAVCNYLTVSQVLWPFDYGPLVIMRVLVENRWGEAAGADMRERVSLVSRFFNEVASDNSGRAVRGEPPLDYEKARAKWTRLVEVTFPQLGYVAAAAATAGTGSGGAGRGRGGGRGGAAGRGAGAAGRGGGTGPVAMHSGRLVCFSFNSVAGCKRQQAARDACKDVAGKHYAHYCNYLDKTRNVFCLQMHPRCANH